MDLPSSRARVRKAIMLIFCLTFYGNCWFVCSSFVFLVGAFSLKEKSPTITVSSFFSVDNLTLSGPLFTICSTSTNFLNPESVGSILALNHKFFILPKVQVRPKGPPFGFFSALCDFFENFRILSVFFAFF